MHTICIVVVPSLLTMYILMKKMAKNEWAFIIITDKSIKQI